MLEEKRAFDEWMQLYACDDPYWKVPRRYTDVSRVGRYTKKLEKLEKRYHGCVDDLFAGVPTYYCVLCVPTNAQPDAIKKAYERKKKCSTYPDVVLERAWEMLSNNKKRSDYDEIVHLFLKILQSYTAKEKRELMEEHDEWVEDEKKHAAWEYIGEKHGGWRQLFYRGAPTFYELLGVDRTKLKIGEEIECKSKGVDERLVEEICKILNNPQLRFEYDFMLDALDEMLDEEYLEEIRSGREFWEGKDASYLMMLRHYDHIMKYGAIMNAHNDWKDYMGDRTFYDVLTIDMASIPEDKREAEKLIRDAYKAKERTPEVNLAYSVLKNFRLRSDYDWMLKNKKWLNMLHEIDVEEADSAQIDAVMELADALTTHQEDSPCQ